MGYRMKQLSRSSHRGSMEKNLISIDEDTGSIPGFTQWVKDLLWREQWCRLQMWPGSGVAMAVVQSSSYSSDLTPGLGTSVCCACGPKETEKKKKKKKERKKNSSLYYVLVLSSSIVYCTFPPFVPSSPTVYR